MVYVHGGKILNCTKATWKAFYTCEQSRSLSFPIEIFLRRKTLRCKKVELGELSPCSKLSRSEKVVRPPDGFHATSEVARPPDLTGLKASYNGWNVLEIGPCMDLSVHVPNGYIKVVFELTSNLKIDKLRTNRSISHGSEYCLCIGVEAYFYGWSNANPDFEIWSDEMAQLKSLCLVLSGAVNSKSTYWPANTSSRWIVAAAHT